MLEPINPKMHNEKAPPPKKGMALFKSGATGDDNGGFRFNYFGKQSGHKSKNKKKALKDQIKKPSVKLQLSKEAQELLKKSKK